MLSGNHTDLGGNMDIDLIFKVGAIGIVVAVFNQILTKTGRDEQAMLVTLAGVIVVMALIVACEGYFYSCNNFNFGNNHIQIQF